MITALPTEVLKHWEVKVHKEISISFCTAPGQSSDLAMLMGQSPLCRSYRNRAEKAAKNKEKFNPPFHNLIQDKKKKSLSVLERQENQILPGKSGFCDGTQVWLFHFHFTFHRKQKLGQTTATGFISLVTSVRVSQHLAPFHRNHKA